MKASLIATLGTGACALALTTSMAFAEQPDKWVSYVESTGSQWVDTGVIGRWNTKIEAKVEWMNLTDSAFVASRSGDNRIYMCYCLNTTGEVTFAQGTTTPIVTLSNGWNTRFEENRVYNFTAELSATNGTGQSTGSVSIDGYSGWSKTVKGVDTGLNLYVFANNRGGGNVGGKSKSRCYGLKIWQGSKNGGAMVLKRDFYPCMKGGRAGLYDDVSKTIFYSISGTELVCDENSEVPDEFIEYVESQGVAATNDLQRPAYIDTGIIGKSATTVEFKETCLCNDREEHCVIGSRLDGNTRFFMWYHASGNKVGLGYGTTYWRPVTTDPNKAGAWDDANLYPLNYQDTTHARVSFAAGSQTFTEINDEENGTEKVWTSLSNASAVDTGCSLYVFARNNNGSPDAFSASRIYFLKIWQNGSLVRHFKPCLKNGVAGLYDEVSKRIFYSLGTPFVFNNVYRQSVKPKEVALVEYIESDGNNTLDTGVPARTGTRAKGVMMWTAEDENRTGKMRTYDREHNRYLENTSAVFWRQKRAYLGARNLRDKNAWFNMLHESNAVLLSQYGNGGETGLKNGNASVPATVGVTNSFDVTFSNGSQTMTWNGAQVLNSSVAGYVDTGDTLHLFSTSQYRWRSAARCYGLEIWQDGVKVRDFKPCRVDGKGMLYDTVTRSIYRPSPDIPLSRVGKVVLTGDEKPVQYVDYVETDGKVFIDTGVIGKAGTTAEFKETSMQKRADTEECFLGSYGGSSDNVSRIFFWYHGWNATALLGYGTSYRPKKNDPTTDATNGSDPDAYKLNSGDTTHARVSFAVGSQTFSTINDATGASTLRSSKTSSVNVNTGRTLYLFAKNESNAGTPVSPAASRFYFLKIWQGNSDGSNMQLVRNFRPARLKNGLVVLWDSVEKKPYIPKSVTAPYFEPDFPVVGPSGAEILQGMMLLLQ